jgi:predicted CoA-binding protein
MTLTDRKLSAILERAQTIAVVGASPNPRRPSNNVARYLIDQGYTVFPVRPGRKRILGRPCYDSLSDIPDKIDIVDVFRVPEACPGVAREAVAAGASVLWLQQDIISEESARIARSAGLDVVMNQCIKIVHQDLDLASKAQKQDMC